MMYVNKPLYQYIPLIYGTYIPIIIPWLWEKPTILGNPHVNHPLFRFTFSLKTPEVLKVPVELCAITGCLIATTRV